MKFRYLVLREVMRARGATMHDIARFAGITVQSAYNKMRGDSEWTLAEAKAIKRGLQCVESIDVLFFNKKNSAN